jgi:hypothetical protein
VDFMGHPYPWIYIPTNMSYLLCNLWEYHPNCIIH